MFILLIDGHFLLMNKNSIYFAINWVINSFFMCFTKRF